MFGASVDFVDKTVVWFSREIKFVQRAEVAVKFEVKRKVKRLFLGIDLNMQLFYKETSAKKRICEWFNFVDLGFEEKEQPTHYKWRVLSTCGYRRFVGLHFFDES